MTGEKDMAVDNNTDNKVSDSAEAASPATDNTNPEETTGGLFAGLSLSSPTSSESTTAPPSQQKGTTTSSNTTDKTTVTTNNKTQTTNEKQPTSRASTPVHSNASPGGDIDNMKKKKATSSPLVVRATVTTNNSSTAPTIPPLSNKSPSTTNNNNITKPQKLSIAIPPSTKISHPDTTLRLLRKFYTKSSTNIPISAGGTQVSSWYGWVFGGSAESGGDMVSILLCFFVYCV